MASIVSIESISYKSSAQNHSLLFFIMLSIVLIMVGMTLIAVDGFVQQTVCKPKVKYLPRSMDAWFKDPKNQPLYMYKDSVFGENVQTF